MRLWGSLGRRDRWVTDEVSVWLVNRCLREAKCGDDFFGIVMEVC